MHCRISLEALNCLAEKTVIAAYSEAGVKLKDAILLFLVCQSALAISLSTIATFPERCSESHSTPSSYRASPAGHLASGDLCGDLHKEGIHGAAGEAGKVGHPRSSSLHLPFLLQQCRAQQILPGGWISSQAHHLEQYGRAPGRLL